ncbi:MAG: hypothetical protein ACOWW1_08090 [archaeon]
MRVIPEKRKEMCPICQHELIDVKYVGEEGIIKNKDDPDYCRDSFENYLDKHGHVCWIEAPKWRRKARGSSEKVVFTVDDYSQMNLEQKLAQETAGDDIIESYFSSN